MRDKPRRLGLSMERKLPLLMTGLLVATMAIGTALAYAEVRRATVETVRERLALVAGELARFVQTSIPQRLELMASTAADPALATYLRFPGDPTAPPALAALERLRIPGQNGARIILFDADRIPRLELGSDSPGAGVSLRGFPSRGYGPFFSDGSVVRFWATAPVLEEGRQVGWIGELRRIGTNRSAGPFAALIGSNVEVFFANAADAEGWVTLTGAMIPRPPVGRLEGSDSYDDAEGEEQYVHAASIAQTPWQVIAQSPASLAMARPRAFLRHAAVVGILLSIAGAGVAWILSRRITQPIRSLRLASEAIAEGDYDRRIHLPRNDELGILADAFNHMAQQVRITHQKLTTQYLTAQTLALDLERASRAKSEFLATISHEIRTPINAIIGYTDLLLLQVEGGITPGQEKQLERIRVSGKHLVGLIDQVLDLARIEAGKLPVESRPSSARDSIETTLTVLQSQAEEKGIELAELPGQADLPYYGDPLRVDQILVNVLSNAIKFTPAGGTVTIACGRAEGVESLPEGKGPFTAITVTDSGIGIPADQHESIFEAFVQVEKGYTRQHGGAGLGLAISRRLARTMGGDLTVRSELGSGSSFTLWLPAAAPRAAREEGVVQLSA